MNGGKTMTNPASRLLAPLLGGLLSAQMAAPVLAQMGPLPPPPAGEGWRPVNPRPLPPGPQPLQPGQPFQLQTTLLLRSGDLIQAVHRSPETLLIAPGETRAVSLSLDTPLRDIYGNTVVPAGAVLEGQFQPVSGGRGCHRQCNGAGSGGDRRQCQLDSDGHPRFSALPALASP